MSRSGLTLWVRLLAVALLGLAGQAVAARPAQAAGCHAEERPVLGLTFSWEQSERISTPIDLPDRPAPAFVPSPCRRESPASSPRIILSNAPAALSSLVMIPSLNPGRRLDASSSEVHPLASPSPLDRPPRPLA